MIKVYLDWNVMSQMKQGFHPELSALMKRRYQFFGIYSTSHISDLLVSNTGTDEQTKRIIEDLKFISYLTENYCAYNEAGSIYISQQEPERLFNDRVDEVKLSNSNTLIENMLLHVDPDSEAYKLIIQMNEMPLPTTIQQAFDDPSTSDIMRSQYPGLEDNPTLGNLIEIVRQTFKNLNESAAYDDLRKTFQHALGTKPNQMHEKQNPFDHIDVLYDKLKKTTGIDIRDNIKLNSNSPEWFQSISNDYLILDMHGYQEDRVRVDERNHETIRNTIDDGFHAAFASMCDFYITNDKKSYRKTKEVYQKTNLNTKVHLPGEFVDYFNTFLNYDQLETHLQRWHEILKSQDFTITAAEGRTELTYQLSYFIFDYFNKCYLIHYEDGSRPLILLSKDKPTNNRFIYAKEVAHLINKLNILFEHLKDGDEYLKPEDINFEAWQDREWKFDGIGYKLVLIEGFLQLYMDITQIWNSTKEH